MSSWSTLIQRSVPKPKRPAPALVLSNDVNNAHSPIVSISPITSNVKRVYSFEVKIPSGTGGLRIRSKVMINQTRAVDKIRLVKKLGRLPKEPMTQINEALKLHYELECDTLLGSQDTVSDLKV